MKKENFIKAVYVSGVCNKKPLYILLCLLTAFFSCEDNVFEGSEPGGGSGVFSLREYKVERNPAVVRNGFGMDLFHTGQASADTLYFPPGENKFPYDLLFYNETAYALLSNGDISGSGYPVIFLFTDTLNPEASVKACRIGQGIGFFEEFTPKDITPGLLSNLSSDPYIRLDEYRTTLSTERFKGEVLMASTVKALYASLVIGHSFRPNIGGVFNLPDVSDESQINLQPVFLIKTREGRYAKFMVKRFKGTGPDTQKITIIWQVLN